MARSSPHYGTSSPCALPPTAAAVGAEVCGGAPSNPPRSLRTTRWIEDERIDAIAAAMDGSFKPSPFCRLEG